MAGDCIILIIAFLLTFQSFIADTINWYLDSRSDKKNPFASGPIGSRTLWRLSL